MATVDLKIYTSAYPGLTGALEVRLYLQSDKNAPIVTQRTTTVGPQPDIVWDFPGLQRSNLLFRTFEMAATTGNTIIQQLGGDAFVTPSANGNLDYKNAVQVEADVTAGFVSGTNTATFASFIGWDIATINRLGPAGPLKRGVDYSYDKATGVITLLAANDTFQPGEWFEITFQPNNILVASSVAASDIFSGAKLVTDTYDVLLADVGSILILDPGANYQQITLPDITTVQSNKLISFEMRRAAVIKCAVITTYNNGTAYDIIDWMGGSLNTLFILPNESIALYKFRDTTDPMNPIDMWRVYNPIGNFMRVLEMIPDDNIAANVFNKIPLIGQDGDVFQHARVYNAISNLPGDQVRNYDDVETASNISKYALANSANPAFANKFKFKDMRGTVERNLDAGLKAGDLLPGNVGAHRHLNVINKFIDNPAFPSTRGTLPTKLRSLIYAWLKTGGGAEGYEFDSDVDEPTLGRTGLPVDVTNSNVFASSKNTVDTIAVNKYIYI